MQKGEGEGVKGCKLLAPIIEKALRYNYQPVSSTANNWFYTRAPKDFQLEAVVPEEKERFIERQSSQDPEIHSLVIRGNEGAGSIPFNIKVKVPEGLKAQDKGQRQWRNIREKSPEENHRERWLSRRQNRRALDKEKGGPL